MALCEKCRGTGLLPFEKSGKIIKGAYIHCSCHPVYGDNPEPERYVRMTPDMYDYPMSGTFRGFSYRYCGVPDPVHTPSENAPEAYRGEGTDKQVVEHIVRHSDLSKQEFVKLRDLERHLKYLQNKLREREKIRQKPETKTVPRVYEVERSVVLDTGTGADE